MQINYEKYRYELQSIIRSAIKQGRLNHIKGLIPHLRRNFLKCGLKVGKKDQEMQPAYCPVCKFKYYKTQSENLGASNLMIFTRYFHYQNLYSASILANLN